MTRRRQWAPVPVRSPCAGISCDHAVAAGHLCACTTFHEHPSAYRFYEVELASADTALVISRSRNLPSTIDEGRQLAPGLWLLK